MKWICEGILYHILYIKLFFSTTVYGFMHAATNSPIAMFLASAWST